MAAGYHMLHAAARPFATSNTCYAARMTRPNPPTLTNDAVEARALLDRASVGTLSTLSREPAGYPFGSLVPFAVDTGDPHAAPLFLISELAEHTRNLRADARASLLVCAEAGGDPLAKGRATLLGRCSPLLPADSERVRGLYLARHPAATTFVDFRDFAFWRLDVSDVRYIAGFGRMSWIAQEAWHTANARGDQASVK
jgi:heme iron utilization protein